MNIQDLPTEIQNKIFYYAAEHPCAKMIKDIYKERIITEVECHTDMTWRQNIDRNGIPYKHLSNFRKCQDCP
jgi:hypothetical protein